MGRCDSGNVNATRSNPTPYGRGEARACGSMSSQVTSNGILPLPAMGCGTWAWGNRLVWNYDERLDPQLQAAFETCVRGGATLFDSGDSYGIGRHNGRSERLLGQFWQAYRGPNRDRICLATKLAAYPWRLTRRALLRAGGASAARLGHKLDLVQLHWSPAQYAPWQEGPLLRGLADCYQHGMAAAVGLSNYGPRGLQRAHRKLAECGAPVATLQIQYSLLSNGPMAAEVRELCGERGIRVIAYSPLALGLLTGKYREAGPLLVGLRRPLFRRLLPGIRPLLQALAAIAAERQASQAQVALNWCLCQGTIPIPGAKSAQQARENLGALGWSLSAGEIAELERAAQRCERRMVQNAFQTR